MDDGDAVRGDRMRIGLGRQAMRRPAGVPDPDNPLHRLVFEPPGEINELALGAAAFDPPVDQGRDPGRIIASIFEAPQPFNQAWRDRLLRYDANDSAHRVLCYIAG